MPPVTFWSLHFIITFCCQQQKPVCQARSFFLVKHFESRFLVDHINLLFSLSFSLPINVNRISRKISRKKLIWNSISSGWFGQSDHRSTKLADQRHCCLLAENLQQDFDISKVANETVENVKEKVSGLIPDKVKEMLPELEKKSSEERPESGKSETSESEATGDKSSDKSASDKKDENNNPDQKPPPSEEEVN